MKKMLLTGLLLTSVVLGGCSKAESFEKQNAQGRLNELTAGILSESNDFNLRYEMLLDLLVDLDAEKATEFKNTENITLKEINDLELEIQEIIFEMR